MIDIPETPIQVMELASMIDVGGGEVIKFLMMNKGIMCTLQQTVEPSVAKEVCIAFGKEIVDGDDDNDDDDDEMEGEEEDDEDINYGGSRR